MPDDWFDLNRPQPLPPNPAGMVVKPGDWFTEHQPQVGSGPPTSDRILDFLRPILASSLVGAGTATGGPIGAGLGMGAATAADLAAQYTQSKPPASIQEGLTNTGTMLLGNELGGMALHPILGAISKLLPKASSEMMNSGLEPTTSQLLEPGKTQRLAKWLEDTFSLGGKKAASERSAALGQQQARELASKITGRPIGEATDPVFLASTIQNEARTLESAYRQLPQGVLFSENGLRQLVNTGETNIKPMNDILNDEGMLQRALNASNLSFKGFGTLRSTNMRRDLQGFALNKFMAMAPDDVVSELDNPLKSGIYGRLFSQRTRADIEQLFTNIARTQEKSGGNPGLTTWSLFHGAVRLPAALLTGSLVLGGYGGAAVTGVTIGGVGLAKMMTNLRLARWAVNTANGMATGLSDKAASRILVGALQGSGAAIGLLDKDGNETKGTVESNDNGDAIFTPSRQPNQGFIPPGFQGVH